MPSLIPFSRREVPTSGMFPNDAFGFYQHRRQSLRNIWIPTPRQPFGGSSKSAGGGIRTHGGLRHRISHPEADLKCGTTLIGRPAPLT